MNHKVFLSILLLGILLQPTYGQNSTGLRCYECTNCWDDFDPQQHQNDLHTCKSGFNWCLKTFMSNRVMVRSCSPSCQQTGYRYTGAWGGTFCCNTDSCNNSHQILNSMALITAGTLLSLFFTRA